MKSVTINRGRCQQKTEKKPEHIRLEEKRQQKVERLTKEIECFSSMQNTCQATVKPDYVFKAATRQKRQTKNPVTIAHLKENDEIISRGKFSKKSAITTGLGKKAVSNYLGKHLTELDLQADVIIDVDSEAVYGQCECKKSDKCTCPLFTTPIRAVSKQGNGFEHSENLTMIKQRKDEAGMSQADWLKDVQLQLHDRECVINYVTSAE
ncbi:unnamed protein product [Mytilus coruscus]|uniref:Uncharacterized protein n=1 Tax=Mytilus coruscus TaxID=42192 RepID=A0A6J8CE90_MYTCO|nr:unnamed protein product [Mytilus coruscus]